MQHMEKVAITVDSDRLKQLDYYLKKKFFKNRSQAFQVSLDRLLKELEHERLATECEKLDPKFEQEMAEMGMDEDVKTWAKY